VTASCTFTLTSAAQPVPSGSSNTTISVAGGSGCVWKAVSNVEWLQVKSGASGTGNGVVTVRVKANYDSQRTGTLTVGGQTATVIQKARR
jgi:hypothetical protein